MTEPRTPRPMPGPRAARPTLDQRQPQRGTPDGREARPQRAKPDPNPLRMLIGLAGLASATAITTALLPSILPATTFASTQAGNDTAVGPQPSVIHVKQVVQLLAGQTAPPNTSVIIPPAPTPQVTLQVITRQSGGKP